MYSPSQYAIPVLFWFSADDYAVDVCGIRGINYSASSDCGLLGRDIICSCRTYSVDGYHLFRKYVASLFRMDDDSGLFRLYR
jgi:hypothetical protein